MTRVEMLEQLEILTKNAEEMDDAARDYERQGTKHSLEQIEYHGALAIKAAMELQDWHK